VIGEKKGKGMMLENMPPGSQTGEGNHRAGYEIAAAQITELITTTGLKAGDRLPTERALGEQLGVSRTVIREAVRFLSAKGIVRTLQGSGLYVESEPPTTALPPLTLSTSVEPKDVESLFEFRLGIETLTARLAAERITPKEMLLLQEAVLLGKQSAEANQLEMFGRSDVDFHRILAEATHNPFLVSTVATIFRLHDWINWLTIGGPSGSLFLAAQQHADIFTALQHGQAEEAAHAMQTHLETSQTNYYVAARQRLVGSEPVESSHTH
jgi:GntR family transcriptional repressor for pyruvate dehydrogenase complex